MNKLMMSALIAAGFSTAAPLTMAQTANPPPGAPQGQHAKRFHPDKQAFSLPSERVEARLAYVKTALKITAAQQSQWDAYAGVVRKQAKEADARMQERRAKWRPTPNAGARPRSSAWNASRPSWPRLRRASVNASSCKNRSTRRCHPNSSRLLTRCSQAVVENTVQMVEEATVTAGTAGPDNGRKQRARTTGPNDGRKHTVVARQQKTGAAQAVSVFFVSAARCVRH